MNSAFDPPLKTPTEDGASALAAVEQFRETCESLLLQQAAIQKTLAAQTALIQSLQTKLETALVQEETLSQAIVEVRDRVQQRNDEVFARLDELEGDMANRLSLPDMRRRLDYRRLIRRMRRVIRNTLPPAATVLVVSKGDEELLDLDVRRAWHFPQLSPEKAIAGGAAGTWAGYNPSGSTVAIVQLEMLRSKGGDFLVFPKTALWWLEYYTAFRRYLDSRYEAVIQDDCCTIYSLTIRRTSADGHAWAGLDELFAEFQDRFDRTPAILDLTVACDLAKHFPQYSVFTPPVSGERLPYIDHSVDIVVTSDVPTVVAEAQRVASAAVATHSLNQGIAGTGSRLDVKWKIDERKSTLPSASIVIPSFNGVLFTEPCVLALFETLPEQCQAEIIVVDDASTDDTQARLAPLAARDPRLRVLRNDTNSGFIDSCNRGAAEASGEVVILLNNDTIPLPGWLPPLLRLLRDRKDAGAVGGKLLFPDGRLQEAGGIIFRDGTGANFGKRDYDPDGLLYNYVREVDYCSGALLATWRSLILELGGLDKRFRPMYYEDTDFCFQVRAKGLKVYYQPASAIIHLEGGSAGTDENQGFKRYQSINHRKFVEKWSGMLKRQPTNPHEFDIASLHWLAIREEYAEPCDVQSNGWEYSLEEGDGR